TAGMDRLANVVGAMKLVGAPVLVIDIGTAVTLDCLNADKQFIGGAILPGPLLQVQALKSYTSALPIVDLSGSTNTPADSTADAIRAGAILGLAGAIERLIIQTKLTLGAEAPVLVTGGYA